MASVEISFRSPAERRLDVAEQAQTRLSEELRGWSDQRYALSADELGGNPLRRVPRGWPEMAANRVQRTARQACVVDEDRIRADASRLAASARSKLLVGWAILAVPVLIVLAVVFMVGP